MTLCVYYGGLNLLFFIYPPEHPTNNIKYYIIINIKCNNIYTNNILIHTLSHSHTHQF